MHGFYQCVSNFIFDKVGNVAAGDWFFETTPPVFNLLVLRQSVGD